MLLPSTVEAAAEASAEARNFAAEFAPDDAPFVHAFLRADAAASAALAGFTADARATGLAQLGLAAPADARAAAAVLGATLAAASFGARLDEVHDAIDPGERVEWQLDETSDLAAIAIEHARLVRARPYFLGNARAARALLPGQLKVAGLSGDIALPISGGLLAVADDYRQALDAGDADAIVLVFAHAVTAAIDNARQLASALAITAQEWDAAMVGVRSHASARDLVGVVLESPVIDARVTVPALGVTLAAAYTAIETLVDRGILVSRGPERRNRAWFAPGILDAVDAFRQRARP